MVVLDSSLVLARMLADPRAAFAEAIIRRAVTESALAPSLLPFEVLHVMTARLRQGQLTEADRERQLRLFATFPIELEPPPDAERLLAITRQADIHGLSGYDATFLELALRNDAEFATLDGQLADAGWRSGLTVHHIEKDLTQRARP
jgi:predicted nucleic acid-binding protein